MKYEIIYYNESVEESILTMPVGLQARYISLSIRMQLHGAHLGEPHTKGLGDGLFELRLKGAEGIARVFYCTLVCQRIVMLHSFVKKTQKTPVGNMRIARSRMQEVKK